MPPSFTELIAYYPLDCDGQDLSGYNRDAVAMGNIKFDLRDAKRNWSAEFDGSGSYFQINAFTQIQIGKPYLSILMEALAPFPGL